MGGGSQHHNYGYWDGESDLNYYRFFIQPAIGFTTRGFDIIGSFRLANLNFTKVSASRDASSGYESFELENIKDNPSSFLFEPGITIRAGWKYVKVQAQYVHSVNLTNPELPYDPDGVTIGIYFTFANRYSNPTPVKPQNSLEVQ
jgi:hypothetical protein